LFKIQSIKKVKKINSQILAINIY